MPKYRHLLAQGYLADVKYQQHYNDYLSARANLESLNSRIASAKSDLSEAQDELEAAPNKLADTLSQLRSQRSALEQQRATSEGKSRRVLRAPVAGRITAIQVHSGQDVDSKRPLMAILPQGAKYAAELFVPSRAIGFVHQGQHVELQYDAFPHERFGVYDGTIADVADAIMTPAEVPAPVKLKQSVYRVKVALDRQAISAYGKSVPLTAGMTLSADIILEKRTLLDWLLDPLYSFKGHL